MAEEYKGQICILSKSSQIILSSPPVSSGEDDLSLATVYGLALLGVDELEKGEGGPSIVKSIGGKIKEYRGEELLRSLLEDLVTSINCPALKSWNDEVRGKIAKDTHIMFENIHPFEDSNGRTGRILYNIHRLNLGLPIHIIHEGDEQMEYYKWFQK